MSLNQLKGKQIPYNIIQNGLKQNRLTSSLLFHGSSHSGKITTAYALAKALNCLTLEHDFCNECSSCKKINRFTHPDVEIINTDDVLTKLIFILNQFTESPNPKLLNWFQFYMHDLFYRFSSNFLALKGSLKTSKKAQDDIIEKINNSKADLSNFIKKGPDQLTDKDLKKLGKTIDFAKTVYESIIHDNIPVTAIRKILHKLYRTPVEGRNKIFIINGLEWMREEGANTFLKGIEEPPSKNYIILITENLDMILPTIKSRCFLVPFHPLSLQDNIDILHDKWGISESVPHNTHNKVNNFWSLLHPEENGTQSLADEFIFQTIPQYREGDHLYNYVDKVVKSGKVVNIFHDIINHLGSIKKSKYGLLKETDHKFNNIPNKVLDHLTKEGEILLSRIDKFNLNPTLALTAYFVKLARHLKSE